MITALPENLNVTALLVPINFQETLKLVCKDPMSMFVQRRSKLIRNGFTPEQCQYIESDYRKKKSSVTAW